MVIIYYRIFLSMRSDSKTVLTSSSQPSPTGDSEALEVSATAYSLGGQEVGERVTSHAADKVEGN